MTKQIEQLIDEALKTEPSFKLGGNFKDRVVLVLRKKEKSNQRKLYFLMALGMLVIFGFGYGTISYFLPSLFESFSGLKNMSDQIIPLAVLIGVMVIIIQYLDKKLIKNRMLQT
ncbi:hypothetical protein SAMN05421640_3232 [Ekhidna lutea]|uniref:Uncharacterized protein n=1 Tax=Ekhidna lutea TaxID=447679 RepID=A0A239LF03_EKHLU|nr:hypothetical protein [Ekhidna lutea]SNT29217.1 hypothetical protein SAMN05421640_3232 [Ekhidna lutea]